MPVDRQRRTMLPDDDSLSLVEGVQALQGEELPADQDAVLEPHEFEARRRPTMTEIDHGAPPPGDGDRATTGALDGLALDELREGETDDPIAATEEGLTYVPPVDPPTIPSEDPQGLDVAAGTGISGSDEPFDISHHGEGVPDDLEMTARIREALRADAATSAYADQLRVVTIGSRAIIQGVVDDVDDADTIVEVVDRVEGIREVTDETTLRTG
jgi:hypothetical protein